MQIVWAHHARCFGKQQLEYIMGTSPTSPGRSFVTGWGASPPTRPHHRNALCAYVLQVRCLAHTMLCRTSGCAVRTRVVVQVCPRAPT